MPVRDVQILKWVPSAEVKLGMYMRQWVVWQTPGTTRTSDTATASSGANLVGRASRRWSDMRHVCPRNLILARVGVPRFS